MCRVGGNTVRAPCHNFRFGLTRRQQSTIFNTHEQHSENTNMAFKKRKADVDGGRHKKVGQTCSPPHFLS